MRRHGVILLASALAGPAFAQTQTSVGVPGRGAGSMAVSYQQIDIRERTVPAVFGGGFEDFGRITLRSVWLEFDYGLGNDLALSAWLPFKSNRYAGDFPHDPRLLDNDHGERLLDDGRFHSAWGDWGLGLRWQWRSEPVAVTPFVSFHWPSHDYPLFTETQVGTGQWRLDLGVNFGGRFGSGLRNLYWEAGNAYSFMEKTEPDDAPARRVNHSIARLKLGWLATPQLGLHLVYARKWTHHGLDFPEQFNRPLFDDQWYYHDQLLKWGGGTLGLGASYRIDDRYAVSADYGRSVDVSFGHKYRHAFTLGFSRSF